MSSSYFEGTCCPLAKIGYSRDGKRNTPQVNYGLLKTRAGCPVAFSVYEGNMADVNTLLPASQLREHFGLERMVLVGDRGMISHKAIDELRSLDGLAWITALKSAQIRALVQGGTLQLGLFDERNLFGSSHPDFPGERLMACRNVQLGKLRAHKREALLEATEQELERIRARVEYGSLAGRDKIGVRVGKVLDRHNVILADVLHLKVLRHIIVVVGRTEQRRTIARIELEGSAIPADLERISIHIVFLIICPSALYT